MQPKANRICIYPKDIQRITGKTYRHSRLYLLRVKEYYGKQEHHLVSLEEFCGYSGLPVEEVVVYLES